MNDDFAGMPAAELLRLAHEAAAPPERLEALYAWLDVVPRFLTEEDRTGLLDALAAHPNSPPNLLIILAGLAPAGFCRNPAAPLLPLEAPDFGERVVWGTAPDLLRRPDVPTPVAAALAAQSASPGVREEASLHVSLLEVDAPCVDWVEEVHGVLSRHCRGLRERDARRQLADLSAVLGDLPEWLEASADTAPLLPCAWPDAARDGALASIVWRPCAPVLRALALSALGPRHRGALREHAASPDWLARLGVVLNPHLVTADPGDSRGILARLSDDGNRLVRAGARAQQDGANRAH